MKPTYPTRKNRTIRTKVGTPPSLRALVRECAVPLVLHILLCFCCTLPNTDISDCDRDLHSPVPAVMPVPPDMEAHRQQALNYSSLAASVAVGAVPTGQDPSISSTETLLRNIQGLLKVAADNARQQERQTSYEKGKLARKCATVREGFLGVRCAPSCAITTKRDK